MKFTEMIGFLFVHKVQPSEITAMAYHELKYWSEWVKYINEK
jgi:hypothetical protein